MSVGVRVATLLPEAVERYEQLHRALPPDNRLGLVEGGYKRMEIHRLGTTLVMLIEQDDALARPLSEAAESASREWARLTEPCFASPWRDALEVFAFDADSDGSA